MATQLAESQKNLKKMKKELDEIKESFEDQKRKLEYTAEQFENLKKEHKQLTAREILAVEDVAMLKKSNDGYRNAIVKNETLMT